MGDRRNCNLGQINKLNVGRIAERIVSNELEFHGFRVIDLNKEGLAANADLLAVKAGEAWQIQVKGTSNPKSGRWHVSYGFCSQAHIDNKREPMFNRHHGSFYRADIVALVAARSPKDYRCVVLPVKTAERAAQLELDGWFRHPKRSGGPRKPGRMSPFLDPPKRKRRPTEDKALQRERGILRKYEDRWELR